VPSRSLSFDQYSDLVVDATVNFLLTGPSLTSWSVGHCSLGPISLQFGKQVNVQTAGADIAHLHAPYPIGEACNLYFGRARKTIISWHSDIIRQKTLLRIYAPVLRRVIAKADHIIASSEPYSRTSPWINAYARKTTVVPYGIDLSRFDMAEHVAGAVALRQSLLAQHPACNFITIAVGRMRHYKGFDDYIRAIASTEGVLGVLVGIGPMEAALKALAQEKGVTNRVIFAGEVSDDELPSYYGAADVFVLPSNSRAEAFGIVNLEAMARGLPLITTEVGSATSWVNEHNVTGLVIPPMNPDALAKAIDAMRDEDMRRRMGMAARERVKALFTREKMVDGIESVYRETLGK